MKYFSILVACIIFIACKNNTKKDDKVYEDTKQSLLTREQKYPLKFLTLTSHYKKNIFGNTVTKGTIINAATLCSYKDVRIKMLAFNKEGAMLEEHEDVMHEIIKPNTVKDFSTRYHLPRKTDSIALSIMSATAVEEKPAP